MLFYSVGFQGKLELDKFFEGIKAAGLNGDLGTDLAHAIW